MQRKVTEIIVHCTATPAGRAVSVDELDRWHRQRGFASIGYHWVVGLDGSVAKGRDEALAGAHCLGHNRNSIGVAYVGGCDRYMRPCDTRTPQQREALRRLVSELLLRYPGAKVLGHNQVAAKSCPCFDVSREL